MTPQLYIIRGPDGHPEAIHQRTETAEGKRFVWWTLGPDGEPVPSLQGRKVESLPLFGSQHVGAWDTSRPVFVVEGEKAMLALANAGQRALGTLGSSVTPGNGALAVLIGLDVALWPDNDGAGIQHMSKIARAIEGAVTSLRWVTWGAAPLGGDAADYLAGGGRIEDLRLEPVPAPRLAPVIPIASRRLAAPRRSASRIDTFNAAVEVSEVLRRDYGIEARPGRAVRCPFHEDRHPSLSVLPDDRRAYCHAPTCWANNDGRGRDAWDLAHNVMASGTVAR
jgi:hypothetical protein